MELNYNEFRSLVFYRKRLPCTYSLDVVDGERYYQLQAAEQLASSAFECTINSVDDPEDTYDFESFYRHLCNTEIIIPGMTPDIQAQMLNTLEGILEEMRLLNRRMEMGLETGVGHDDIASDS